MTEKEKTAPVVSVGADTEQSILKQTNDSITDFNEKGKSLDDYLEEMQKEFLQQLDPSHLKTISMRELYNTVYQSKPPLIDGLLYPGTYIFAGAPKLGKSFLMAQFAYHISTGTPLWNFDVRKGTVLYLALEDDYHRLQERLYRMFGTESANNLYFSVSAGQLGNGLDEQLTRFMSEHPDTKLIIIDTLQRCVKWAVIITVTQTIMRLSQGLKSLRTVTEYVCCLFIIQESKIPMTSLI